MTHTHETSGKETEHREDDAGAAPAGDGEAGSGPDPAAEEGRPTEVGGPKGPEPTRYGDWEKNGIASDF